MAKVRAIRLCFVDNSLRQEGDEFDYEGPENGNLEYLEGSARKPGAAKGGATPAASEDEDAAPARKWTPKSKRAADGDADEAAA